ncbi:DEAD/DEAH box helicase [Cohnella terricola]|uniref:DEAD/DEAH box helicase n=1 Tax=Cohnella terricola TaxID=1289167 RepID=A0A559JFZ3_9BACL|nr:DEAD/DEAH box helicase [Cohnella terricola]TVX98793.1 DEAD/DEAH box helicase [Cohnella terricola]
MSFQELGLGEALAGKLAASGIEQPSEVQKQAIPALLAGKDGVLVSPTGTGKTLAYLLPLLQQIDGSRKEVQALALAPTQELAMQIMREAEAYGAALGIKAVALIGGASLSRQLERMKSKPALIVGTPGRVREVANTRKLSLHAVRFIVVDETDRIFSLGGKNDVEHLLKRCARERQTVFVSATRSEAMKEAERKWQKDAWISDVTEKENENGLSSTLQHWYFLGDRRDKIDLVQKIVRHMKPSSALLFVNDTEKIGELQAKLRYEGFSVDALYGDTRGQERGEVMQRFRNGRTKLLIATDVAARGLDLPGLPLVIQLEPALDADHYVHRSGRTARMGREGTSITLIAPEERFMIDKLEKQLNIQVQPKMLYEGRVVSYEEGVARRSRGASGRQPQGAGADAKDARPVWKSKAEYLAGLEARQAAEAKPRSRRVPEGKPATVGSAQAEGSGREAKKPGLAAKPAQPPVKPAKSKVKRAREQKNKGAPKWLKAKREAGATDKPSE